MAAGTLAPLKKRESPLSNRDAQEPVSCPAPVVNAPGKWLRAGVVIAALLLTIGVFSARAFRIARGDSITSDEATHLLHCLHFWATGDDLAMWQLGAPRFPHALYGLASYWALKLGGLVPLGVGGDELVRDLNRLVLSDSQRVLLPARAVAVLWGVSLLGAVFWATYRIRGAWTALAATALVSLVPEVIAHSAIAGSDVPFTAAAFLSLILLSRYAESPSMGRWLGVSTAVGLAWAMRHTALVLVLLAGCVHLVCQWRRQRPAGLLTAIECVMGTVWAGALLTLLAGLVLWAGDGFEVVSIGEVSERVTMVSVPRQLGELDLSRLPVPASFLSILKQIRHQNQGHEAYFLGQRGTTGWGLYFPAAFLLKTPLAFLALAVLTCAVVRPRGSWDAVAIAFLGVLWLMLVRNKVNIGLRYALLTYPIAATFMARLYERRYLRDWVWGPVTVAGSVALVWASLGCGTRCLSYFNELGGGSSSGWLYLADSNLDWGQDFQKLRHRIGELGIKEITYDLQSERRLFMPGVAAVPFPPRALQVPAETPANRRLYDSEGGYLPVYTRYFAVSVSRLMGLYSQNDMSWLRTRRIVDRVGDSIFLFDMDEAAEVPFYW